MNLIERVTAFFGGGESSGLLCPRCEKSLEGHDEAACERKMSRRYFFGLTMGAVAAGLVAPVLPEIVTPTIIVPSANYILTPQVMARLVLESLQRNLVVTKLANVQYEQRFGKFDRKIGDTLRIHAPQSA